jgi:SRSO17 transposase
VARLRGSGQGAATRAARHDKKSPLAAWIVDDTGLPKKGRHSVGVACPYCGQLGKQEICRVGHFEGRGWRGFHHHATLCIAAYGFLVAD